MKKLYNIIVDPSSKYIRYQIIKDSLSENIELEGKLYSAYDSEKLMTAIDLLQDYYDSLPKGE